MSIRYQYIPLNTNYNITKLIIKNNNEKISKITLLQRFFI